MKFLFVLSSLLFFVGCEDFEYHQFVRKQGPGDSNPNFKSNFEPSDVEKIDFQTVTRNLSENLIESTTKAVTSKKCIWYKSGIRVSRFDFYSNAVKRCFAYAVDKALYPMCIHEIELKHLKNKHQQNKAIVVKIDESLKILEGFKNKFIHQMYGLSDKADSKRAKYLKKKGKYEKDLLMQQSAPAGDYNFSTFPKLFEDRALRFCPNFKPRS